MPVDETRRKFGAPPKREAEPGERFQLGVRVTAALKRKLDAAAEQSGRSQSQEAELRLEHTFDRQGLLSEVLTLAYGKEIAADLMLFGEMMRRRDVREIGGFQWHCKHELKKIPDTTGRRERLHRLLDDHFSASPRGGRK